MFLQSDVLDAVTAMRDEFEQHAGDILQLSPLHNTAPVFHWTREQEAATAAAAAAVQADGPSEQQQGAGVAGQSAAAGGAVDTHQDSSSSASSSEEEAGSSGEEEEESGHGQTGSSGGSSGVDPGSSFVSSWAAGGWLVDNPLGVPTERENYVLSQGGKVFRVLLVKKE